NRTLLGHVASDAHDASHLPVLGGNGCAAYIKDPFAAVWCVIAHLLRERNSLSHCLAEMLLHQSSINRLHAFQRLRDCDEAFLRILSDDSKKIFREHPCLAARTKLPASQVGHLFGMSQQLLASSQLGFGGPALSHILRKSTDQADRPARILDRNGARE